MPDNWFFTILSYFTDIIIFFSKGMGEFLRLPLASMLILALSAGYLALNVYRVQQAAERDSLALKQSNQRFADAIKPLYQRLDQAGEATGEFETALVAARRIVALYGNLPGEQRAATAAYLTFVLLEHSRAQKP